MSKPTKPRYHTTNWQAYNASLIARGAMLICIDPQMQWTAQAGTGKRGCSPTFSDTAIQLCLMLKALYNLPLRQTTGMVQGLLKLAGLSWPVPERKVHLAIDAQMLEIRAVEVTSSSVGDAPMLPNLINQISADDKIISVSGDGAYDTKACHAAIARRGAQALIPVRRNGQLWREGPM